MKNVVLFCAGLSGSGKSYFIKNTIPAGLFYNLKSATTREPRNGETDGNPYFFRDEKYFETTKLATKLWVNEDFWHPGDKKWMYGVPESEILNNIGKNFTYDVIEPRYVRQMIDWFKLNKLDREYSFKTAWFIPPQNNFDIASSRANMPHDLSVRRNNTCDAGDFMDANIWPDYILRPITGHTDQRLMQYIWILADQMNHHR